MAQRRFHYDAAFEHYLRQRQVPYVMVDEAKRALTGSRPPTTLKNFDFVVYSQSGCNLLVDVKGRKIPRTGGSLQNWVTADDVNCLQSWAGIFGNGFAGTFAFLYWCDGELPDGLFQDQFTFGSRWYAVLGVRLEAYRQHMRQRSPKWGTVCLPTKVFRQIAQPLSTML